MKINELKKLKGTNFQKRVWYEILKVPVGKVTTYKNIALNIKNISSKETKCKKNKIGQCFQSNTKSIDVTIGRSDQVKFQDSNLILTILGSSQKFKLKNLKLLIIQ